MTTVPSNGSVFSAARMASTAAASAAFSSPRPINFDAAPAAASVTRTISSTRTRSRTGDEAGSATFMALPIRALAVLVHPVLKQIGADPDRARSNGGFDEEDGKCRPDRQHR